MRWIIIQAYLLVSCTNPNTTGFIVKDFHHECEGILYEWIELKPKNELDPSKIFCSEDFIIYAIEVDE